MCSLRIKSKLEFSFSEMRRLYSIKFKKSYTHRQRIIKKSWKELMRETLQGTFKLVKVTILVHSFKKEKKSY